MILVHGFSSAALQDGSPAVTQDYLGTVQCWINPQPGSCWMALGSGKQTAVSLLLGFASAGLGARGAVPALTTIGIKESVSQGQAAFLLSSAVTQLGYEVSSEQSSAIVPQVNDFSHWYTALHKGEVEGIPSALKNATDFAKISDSDSWETNTFWSSCQMSVNVRIDEEDRAYRYDYYDLNGFNSSQQVTTITPRLPVLVPHYKWVDRPWV